MANENAKDALEFAHSVGGINMIKLDGANFTKLSRGEVYNFFIDNKDNIYYSGPNIEEKDENIYRDGYISLYKVGFGGSDDTKVADNISSVFYVANDQVYYMDPESSILYRKAFNTSEK